MSFYDSTVPYTQSGTFSLYRFSFTNEPDSSRYTVELNNNHVTSVGKFDTSSGEKCGLLNYIENPYASTPLLVQIDPSYHKLKLSVSHLVASTSKSILIVKSREFDEDTIRSHIDNKSDAIEISKLDSDQLPINPSVKTEQRFIINDGYKQETFDNGTLFVSLWVSDGESIKMQFGFGVWITARPTIEQLKQPQVQVGESNDSQKHVTSSTHLQLPSSKDAHTHHHPAHSTPASFTVADFLHEFTCTIDDGPGFRNTIKLYEEQLPQYKKTCGSLLEELKRMELLLKRILLCKHHMVEALIVLGFLQFSRVMRLDVLAHEFITKLQQLFVPFEKNLTFFLTDVCDPKLVQKIYLGLPNLEGADYLVKKKQFEATSKEYYNWLQKYLSNEKERPELKLLVKRKQFELVKFDYLNELNLTTNNQYVNQLLERLFKFTGLEFDRKNNKVLDFSALRDAKKSQELLGGAYVVYLTALLRFNSEKHQLRQRIEACTTNEELTYVIRFNSLSARQPENDTILRLDTIDQLFEAVPEKPPQLSEQGEFSGILFALGGQGKQGWHKEWVVLNKGQMIEYSNWRKGTAPVHEPIEVALSSAKPVVYDKRQFCFEVITSRGSKHVFQAINEDERGKWMKALYNAGQVFDANRLDKVRKEGKDKVKDDSNDKVKRGVNDDKVKGEHIENTKRIASDKGDLKKPQTNKGNGASNVSPKLQPSPLKVLTEFEKPVIPLPADRTTSPVSILSKMTETKDYLAMVRSIPDSDNHICADCKTTEAVEWISINFLVCFCVNCASGHRNLGLHISKIRSLRLDNFENELEVLLGYVNNRRANKYLEARKEPNTNDLKENIGETHNEESKRVEKLPAVKTAQSTPKTIVSPKNSPHYHQSPHGVFGSPIFSPTSPTESSTRFGFIRAKYANKQFALEIPHINNTLIRAVQKINFEDILKCLGCGADTLLNVQMTLAEGEPKVVLLFAYSLRKFVEVGHKKLFVVSELLILNGCKVDKELAEIGISEEGKEYWRKRLA